MVAVAFDRVCARGLLKMYGRTKAVAGIDLELPAGVVTVIEGPNGSGKSTLLAMLALLARPTRGEVLFGKEDAFRSRRSLRSHVGILAHSAMLYPDLTGLENLSFFADLAGLNAQRIEQSTERFGIGAFGKRPVRTYSRGQLQRVALARSLLSQPTFVLLDEPSTGLDVAGVEQLVEVVRAERARGAIVAVVTHDRRFAEQVADIRLQLKQGRLVS